MGYLGQVISSREVEPDQSEIQAMVQWPITTTLKQLRGFLGLTGYCQHFLQIMLPWHKL